MTIKGMEKQDQMSTNDFAQFNMLGNTKINKWKAIQLLPYFDHYRPSRDFNRMDTRIDQKEEGVTMPQAFQEFTLGETALLGLLIVYASGTVLFLRVMPSY